MSTLEYSWELRKTITFLAIKLISFHFDFNTFWFQFHSNYLCSSSLSIFFASRTNSAEFSFIHSSFRCNNNYIRTSIVLCAVHETESERGGGKFSVLAYLCQRRSISRTFSWVAWVYFDYDLWTKKTGFQTFLKLNNFICIQLKHEKADIMPFIYFLRRKTTLHGPCVWSNKYLFVRCVRPFHSAKSENHESNQKVSIPYKCICLQWLTLWFFFVDFYKLFIFFFCKILRLTQKRSI